MEKAKSKKAKSALTRRERLLFKHLADNPGITIRDVGRRAGYAESTVRSIILN